MFGLQTTKKQALQKNHMDAKSKYVEYEEAQYQSSMKEITSELSNIRLQINEKLEELRIAELESE